MIVRGIEVGWGDMWGYEVRDSKRVFEVDELDILVGWGIVLIGGRVYFLKKVNGG